MGGEEIVDLFIFVNVFKLFEILWKIMSCLMFVGVKLVWFFFCLGVW